MKSSVNIPEEKPRLSDILSRKMKETGMTSVTLAEMVSVPATTLKSWFQRNSFPSDKIMPLIEGVGIRFRHTDDIYAMASFNVARASKGSGLREAHMFESIDTGEIDRIRVCPRLIQILGATQVGKTTLYSESNDLIHLPFSPNEPIVETISRVQAELSPTAQGIIRSNAASIANVLSSLTHTKSLGPIIFDGMEHLDTDSSRILVQSILQLWNRDNLSVAYTAFSDSDPSFERDQLLSQSAPHMFHPYSPEFLIGYVEFILGLAQGSRLTHRIVVELAELHYHRKLVHVFLDAYKQNQAHDDAIIIAKRVATDELRVLLGLSYPRCGQLLKDIERRESNMDGEEFIEYSFVGKLLWADIEYLISTTLFGFKNGKLYTTRLIDQSMKDAM